MPLTIKNKFGIEQSVFLKTDAEQLERTVVYIVVQVNGLMYGVRYADNDVTEHYDYELATERFVK